VLAENRFLAARDGMQAALIDPSAGGPVPVRRLLERTLAACEAHAAALGCREQLAAVKRLAERPGAARQRTMASGPEGLAGLLAALADAFAPATPPAESRADAPTETDERSAQQ